MYEFLALFSFTGIFFFGILAFVNIFRKKKRSLPHIAYSLTSIVIFTYAVYKIVQNN